ncbi:MAG: DASS family sodium-coupled anion symporter [Planctomycetota bacterium]|nr:DASS family sodium-coupled anion symporter [Planctomycetota bacterium]
MTGHEPRTARATFLRVGAGVVAGALVYALLGAALSEEGRRVAALGVCIALWWVTEALPLEATGLAPIALFPLFGVATVEQAAAPYANPVIFLFLGGMILGQAMERWNLHRRVALWALAQVGAAPFMLIGGVLAITAFLSMWVSNTAAAVMMAPIAASIAGIIASPAPGARRGIPLGAALLLAVAYGASIGGLGSLIGTPPTAQFAAFMQRELDRPVSFGEWLRFGLCIVLIMGVAAWGVLSLLCAERTDPSSRAGVRDEIARQRRDLGAWTMGERVVLGTFLVAAFGWLGAPALARAPDLAGTLIADVCSRLKDSVVAIAAALALFILPGSLRPFRPVLTWHEAERVPWGVLILSGGGLSLADALSRHGVDAALAGALAPLAGAPLLVLLFVLACGAIILTEFASNTALAAAALPVALAVARSMDVPPPLLLVTIVVAASLGFMMPAGTPPNAIVYATRRVTMRQMMNAGFRLDLLAAALAPVAVYAAWKLGLLPGT